MFIYSGYWNDVAKIITLQITWHRISANAPFLMIHLFLENQNLVRAVYNVMIVYDQYKWKLHCIDFTVVLQH